MVQKECSTEVPEGHFVAEFCKAGTALNEGSDLQVKKCTNHEDDDNNTHLVDCVPGTPSQLGSDAYLDTCTKPSADEYVVKPCTAADDAVIKKCSNVKATPGKNFEVECSSGSPGVAGTDAYLQECSNPGPGQFVSSICTKSKDTEFAPCSPPTSQNKATFVSSLCVQGSSDTKGSDLQETACSTPNGSQFVSDICDIGSSYAVGSDSKLASCSNLSATKGNFLTSCQSGSAFVLGADASLQACSKPLPGQYLVRTCNVNSDTVIAACSQPSIVIGVNYLVDCVRKVEVEQKASYFPQGVQLNYPVSAVEGQCTLCWSDTYGMYIYMYVYM